MKPSLHSTFVAWVCVFSFFVAVGCAFWGGIGLLVKHQQEIIDAMRSAPTAAVFWISTGVFVTALIYGSVKFGPP